MPADLAGDQEGCGPHAVLRQDAVCVNPEPVRAVVEGDEHRPGGGCTATAQESQELRGAQAAVAGTSEGGELVLERLRGDRVPTSAPASDVVVGQHHGVGVCRGADAGAAACVRDSHRLGRAGRIFLRGDDPAVSVVTADQEERQGEKYARERPRDDPDTPRLAPPGPRPPRGRLRRCAW